MMKKLMATLLILLGILIIAISSTVFEHLIYQFGPEFFVGPDSVIRRPDGTAYYTNPVAMMKWVFLIALPGILLVSTGIIWFFRQMRNRKSPVKNDG